MAAIHDLLAQVQDQALRERIEKEIDRLSKTKKFRQRFLNCANNMLLN